MERLKAKIIKSGQIITSDNGRDWFGCYADGTGKWLVMSEKEFNAKLKTGEIIYIK